MHVIMYSKGVKNKDCNKKGGNVNPFLPRIQEMVQFSWNFLYIAKRTVEDHIWNFITLRSLVPEIWVVAIWIMPAGTQEQVQNWQVCNKKEKFSNLFITLNIVYVYIYIYDVKKQKWTLNWLTLTFWLRFAFILSCFGGREVKNELGFLSLPVENRGQISLSLK